jgi:NADH-ubiquinone oxidoreductase chain 4
MVVLVFLVKLPVFFLHLWLPKAHVEAPLSGSMLLAGVFLKIGVYGLIRFFSDFYFFFCFRSGYIFSLGLLGGLLSCLFCFRQVDLKSLVAYSSICHMGLCLAGVLCFSYCGVFGRLSMSFSHGLVSPCLFYLVYVIYYRFYVRSIFLLKGGLGYCPFLGL